MCGAHDANLRRSRRVGTGKLAAPAHAHHQVSGQIQGAVADGAVAAEPNSTPARAMLGVERFDARLALGLLRVEGGVFFRGECHDICTSGEKLREA